MGTTLPRRERNGQHLNKPDLSKTAERTIKSTRPAARGFFRAVLGALALVTLMCGLAAPAVAWSPNLAPSAGQIVVTWTAPSVNGIDIYLLFYRIAGSSSVALEQDTSQGVDFVSPATSPHTIKYLLGGQRYEVKVQAADAAFNVLSTSDAVFANVPAAQVPTAPSAPALTPDDHKMGVAWNAPAANGAPITDYDVRYKESGFTVWTDHTYNGIGTSTTITGMSRTQFYGLTNGQSYDVQVRARNSVGWSGWSPSTSAIPVPPPAKPIAFGTSDSGDGFVTFLWVAPDPSDVSISKYQYLQKAGAGNWGLWTDIKDSSPTTKSFTAKGLTNFVIYSFQIRAVNSIGPGPASTTRTGVPIVPLPAPTSLTATPGNTGVDLRWTMPSGAWDSYVYAYEYQKKEGPTGNWGDWTQSSSALLKNLSTTHTVTGLTNGTAYHFKVRAMNLSSPGQASSEASATPTAQAPAKPETPTLIAGHQQLTVSWTAPANNGATINDYDVRYKQSSASRWTNRTHSGTTASTVITGLTNGQSYLVKVRAKNTVGTGDWSPNATATPATQVPATPLAPTLAPRDQKIEVAWTGPADNGEAISDYDVQYKTSRAANWTDHSHIGTGRSTTITGLTNGQNYQVQVRAINTVGTGDWSPSTSAIPVPPPDQPYAFGTSDSGDGFVTFLWVAPNPLDMSIIKYQYQHKIGSTSSWGSTWTNIPGSGPTTKSATIRGLTNFVKYSFQIRAVNSSGPGPASTTRTGDPFVPLPAPTGLTATPGDSEVELRWTMPSGAWDSYVFTYEYQMKEGASGSWGDWTGRSRGLLKDLSTTHTVTGLTNGTAYHFKVRAMNLSNPGQASSAASAAPVPAKAPAQPGAPTLTAGHQQLTVAWIAPANNRAAINDYDVRYRPSIGTAWNNGNYNGTGTSTTLTGLTNGESYLVQVRAINRAGRSKWSPSATGRPATQVPAQPEAPALTPGNKQLGVTWNAPAANGAPISDYDVQYKTSSAASWTDHSHTGTGRRTTIAGLTNGQGYDVQVRAINTVGTGNWSPSTSATPAVQVPTAPSAPALTPDDHKIGVTWTAPADNGAPINDYDVQYKESSVTAWTDHSHTGAGTSTTITGKSSTQLYGLYNGTNYDVQVRARNSVGWSGWSPSTSATPEPRPVKPFGFGTTDSGDGFVTLIWAEPNPRDMSIIKYQYLQKAGAGNLGLWTDIKDSSRTTKSFTAKGLTNFVKHSFQIRAVNSIGPGPASPTRTGVPIVPLPAPTSLTATPGNTEVDLSWTMPSGAWDSYVFTYEYQMKEVPTGNWGDWTRRSRGLLKDLSTTHTVTGLNNGTAYHFKVRAMNLSNPGQASSEASATPTAQVPAKPEAPALTPGNKQLGVAWTAPANNGATINDYDVQYRAGNSDPWTDANYTGVGTSTTITGLANGQAYDVQVRATNTVGTGDWSPNATATPATQVPATPLAPTLAPRDQKIEVAWTAPADNGEAISDYDVQYKTSSAANWTDANYTGTGTSTTITGLANGTSYQVQVRAINTVGTGDWSPSTSAIPVPPPDQPYAFGTSDSGDGFVTLTWNEPNPLDMSIIKYQYQHKIGSTSSWGSTWTNIPGSGPTTKSATIRGLTNFVKYSFQIRAVNSSGPGPASTTRTGDPFVPLPAPTGLTATPGDSEVELRWTMPSGAWDSYVFTYEYQMKEGASGSWGDWTGRSRGLLKNLSTTHTVTGLTNGTAYHFKVRAMNLSNPGQASSAASAAPVPAKAPAQPGAPTLTAGHQQLTVAWIAPANNRAAINDYDVRYRPSIGGTWTDANYNGTGTSTTITGLTNGESHLVQVRAINRAGRSKWSPSATGRPATQVPAQPATPALTPGNKQLGVAWNAPAANGAPISDYDVQYKESGVTAWTDHTHTGAGRRTTIAGLTNGQGYDVQVRAINTVGTGDWSPSTSATPAVQVPTVPSAPALTPDDHKIGVTWTAPADNGAPINDYDVQYKESSVTAWTDHSHTGAGTSTTITGKSRTQLYGLYNGTNYDVQVRARNSVGWSGWSPSTSATPEPRPVKPFGFGTTDSGDGFVTLIWAEPNPRDMSIIKYQYRQKAGAGNWGLWTDIKDSSRTTKSFTAKGLTNFVKHSFQIRAVNSIGPGPASPTRTGVPIVPLPAPTSLTATPGNTEVDLSWTMPSGAWDSYVFTYEYQMKEVPTGNWGDWTRRSRGLLKDLSTTHTVTGLNNGTAYHFKVRAMNLSNPGQASSEASATPTAQVPAKPEAPALTPGNKQLGVAWTAPANNGAPINDYDVQYRAGNSDPWTDANYTGVGTSTTITGLANGQAYDVQVRATNTVGTGDWSPNATATPATQVPATPLAPTLAPRDQKIEVTWTAPADNGEAISDYDVQYKTSSAANWTDANYTGTGTSTTITGLANGTSYQVQVRAINTVGTGDWSPSTSAIPVPPPDQPYAFGTSDSGDGFVTLTWNEPNPRDMSISKYQYQHKIGSTSSWGSTWTNIPGSGPTTKSATIRGLTNFVKYSFQIRAVNSSGPGPASTTRTGDPFVPLPAPTGLTATPGDSEVELRWTMPSGAWDSYVFTYEYQMKEGASGSWGDWTGRSRGLLKNLSTTHTVTGLTNGTAYHFKVRAMNLSNPGQASSAASAAPVPAKAPAQPGAPTLTAGHQQLTVAWIAPANNRAAINDYDVRYRPSIGGTWTDANYNGTGTSTTLTGLTNGESYLVQVRAINRAGRSKWSPSATGRPATQVPAQPEAPALTPGNKQLGVAWTAPAANGAPISDYDVQYKESGVTAWTDHTHTGAGRRTTIAGLTNGQGYDVQVRAINTVGTGDWSPSTSATPAVQVPTAPSAPALTPDDHKIGVTWTAPADNGASINDYDVQYKESGVTAWTDHSHTGAGTSTTITGKSLTQPYGLYNGTNYDVQVRARNSVGWSGWSPSTSAKPEPRPVKPFGFGTTDSGDGFVTLIWAEPNPRDVSISKYQYRQKAGAGNWACGPTSRTAARPRSHLLPRD